MKKLVSFLVFPSLFLIGLSGYIYGLDFAVNIFSFISVFFGLCGLIIAFESEDKIIKSVENTNKKSRSLAITVKVFAALCMVLSIVAGWWFSSISLIFVLLVSCYRKQVYKEHIKNTEK